MRKNIFLTMALLVSLCQGVLLAQQDVQTLTMNDLFVLAEQNNHRLAALGAGLEEATEEVRVAEGAMLPSAKGSLRVGYNGNGYVMDRDFSNGMVAEIPSFANNFSLEVSQVIYAGGAIRGAIGLAERKNRWLEI